MKKIVHTAFIISSLFISGSALACNGVFDPQTGICHQSGGYQISGQLNGQAQPKDYWGALAIDAVNGNTSGSGQNFSDRKKAENAALRICNNNKDCRVAVSYKNSCGSVATNGQGVRLGASDPNPTQAERKALAACNKQSNVACRIWIKAECSGVGY